jgi:hypothetical protein
MTVPDRPDCRRLLAAITDRLTKIETLLENQRDQEKDHETRLRSLEKREAMLVGGAALLSATLGFILKGLGWE